MTCICQKKHKVQYYSILYPGFPSHLPKQFIILRRRMRKNNKNNSLIIVEQIVEPIVEQIVEQIVEPIVAPIVDPVVEPVVEPKCKPGRGRPRLASKALQFETTSPLQTRNQRKKK
jgi:hypothetical protein